MFSKQMRTGATSVARASRASAARPQHQLFGASKANTSPTAASVRHFSAAAPSASVAMQKLQKGLASELQFEKENYEKPEPLSKLPADWKLVETPGDVNMMLQKDIGTSKICKVEWQLVSPYDADMDDFENPDAAQGEQQIPEPESETDFTITIETKDGESGMTLFCNTQQDGSHRHLVGNVKTWNSVKERDNPTAYNGPDFEDLEDRLREAIDEYLGEIGVNDAIYDFIDAAAVDKETREYMRWLENLNNFMK